MRARMNCSSEGWSVCILKALVGCVADLAQQADVHRAPTRTASACLGSSIVHSNLSDRPRALPFLGCEAAPVHNGWAPSSAHCR